jgi:hypothetical protein
MAAADPGISPSILVPPLDDDGAVAHPLIDDLIEGGGRERKLAMRS